MADKIKTGEFRVSIENEEAIWCDKKRIVFFGLPLSFTKYTLTPSKFIIEKGFFKRSEEELRLYRVTDVSLTRGFFERIFGLGTVQLLSSDTSTPVVKLIHIKKPKTVKDVLSQSIELCRRENGVHTSEMVGTPFHRPPAGHGGEHGDHGEHDGHPAIGPQIIPDLDQNGVDDTTE